MNSHTICTLHCHLLPSRYIFIPLFKHLFCWNSYFSFSWLSHLRLLSSRLKNCHSQDYRMCRMLLLATIAKLPSCIIATPSDTAINPFFQNPLQNYFQECIPNLPHKCSSSIKKLSVSISDRQLSLYHQISFIVSSLEPCFFSHF